MRRMVYHFFALCTFLLVAGQVLSQSTATCGFSYKKVITIQGSQITGGPHADFPILIDHTDGTNLTTAAGKVTSANGYDIVFADDNANLLDFQLEEYDGSTGHVVAWVKIPSLTNGTNVVIHMLYGKASITTDQSSTSTWDANFRSVYHFNNNDLNDQTVNTNNGTNNGTANDNTSKIAGGRTFGPGNGDYVQVATTGWATGAGTIELWGNQSSFSGAHQYYFGHTTLPAYANRIQLYTNDAAGNLDLGLGNSHSRHTNIQNLNTNQWYHIALTWDGTNYAVYVDGVSAATGTYSGLSSFNSVADIGNDGNSAARNEGLIGDLDEFRIHTSVRSANWIATSHDAQNSPEGTFYTITTEMSTSFTSTTNGDWDNTATWGGTSYEPHVGVDVDVQHDVDIDNNSSDYIVCNCDLTGTGARDVFLDISSTRVLTVLEDMDANHSAGGASYTHLQTSNTAVVNVQGNMAWSRTNTNGDADLEINMRDNSVINLTGNIDYNLAAGAGDDITLDMEDDSDFNVGGNFTLDQDAGDEMRWRIDDNATVDITGNLVLEQDGGDDILLMLNAGSGTSAEVNVGGNVTVTHTTGDDIEFETNAANSHFDITGTFTATLTGDADDQILDFNLNNGDFDVTTVNISRSVDNGFVHFDLDGGDFTCTGLTFSSAGTLFNDGYINIEVDQASVFTVNGNTSVTMTGADDFRVEVNTNGGSTGQFINTGNFTVTRSGGDDIEFFVDDDNSIFRVDGNLTITSTGGETVIIDLDNDALFDVNGNMLITHSAGQNGTITLAGGGDNPTLDVASDFTLTETAGDDNYTFNLDGGNFNVGRDFSILESSGIVQMHIDMDGGNMTVTRDFLARQSGVGTSGEILVDVDNGSSLTVNDDMELEINGGNDVELHLEENNTAGNSTLAVADELILDHNGGTGGDDIQFIMNDNAVATVGGDFTMDTDGSGSAGNFYTRLNNSARLSVSGNINMNTINNSGYLEIELNNTSELEIGGNFVRAASPNNYGILDCNGTSTVEYKGVTNTQQFAEDAGAGTDNFDYQNVIINNTFGTTPQITMQGTAVVHAGIQFVDGIVSSSTTNLLIVDDNATSTGASDISHVDGDVRKVGDDAFTFPVGDANTYLPIGISTPGATGDHFTARYFQVDPWGIYCPGCRDVTINRISSCEYWTLDRTNGSSNVFVTLAWKQYNPGGQCSGVNNLPELTVARWDGSNWRDEGNGVTTGAAAAGDIRTLAAVTNFSPFTLASTTTNNPLPVTLLSFEGIHAGTHNVLNWVTQTEINNDYFTLERSEDGQNFQSIATIQGAGNSNDVRSYQHLDHDLSENLYYYRLKQTDYNGSFTYSEVIAIESGIGQAPSMQIYPNPSSDGSANLVLKNLPDGAAQLKVTNTVGQLVDFQSLNGQDENQMLRLEHLPSGMYLINVTYPGGSLVEKFSVR